MEDQMKRLTFVISRILAVLHAHIPESRSKCNILGNIIVIIELSQYLIKLSLDGHWELRHKIVKKTIGHFVVF